MRKDVEILVPSCDKYASLWPPFVGSLFKYWPRCPFRVNLGVGHETFADARVRVLSYGEDRGYCENLDLLLSQLDADWVIIWVEDRLLSEPVDERCLLEIIDAAQRANAAYVKLIPEHPMAYNELQQLIGPVPKGTPYRVSMTVCLWNKAALRALIRPGESAWELERKGSIRSDDFTQEFMGLSRRTAGRPPIVQVHTVMQGKLLPAGGRFLRREGYQHTTQKWGRIGLRSLSYLKIYEMVMPALWRTASRSAMMRSLLNRWWRKV